MIKRKYFFSVRVAHNDDSGDYSWWHDMITRTSLMPEQEETMEVIRREAMVVLADRVPRRISRTDVEFVSFNRI